MHWSVTLPHDNAEIGQGRRSWALFIAQYMIPRFLWQLLCSLLSWISVCDVNEASQRLRWPRTEKLNIWRDWVDWNCINLRNRAFCDLVFCVWASWCVESQITRSDQLFNIFWLLSHFTDVFLSKENECFAVDQWASPSFCEPSIRNRTFRNS